jgi:GT2 family glycosyltransferase
MYNAAILMTCFNRVKTTLACLEHLFNATKPDNFSFDIYLVDDNSPDGTGKIVKQKYPEINVIYGTGSLYWNQGMRLTWETAAKIKDYDYYLWLNDDTILNTNAIKIIFEDYNETFQKTHNPIIVAGTCCDNTRTNFTYGGRTIKAKPIIPAGYPQFCQLINGNIVWIPQTIFSVVGNLSSIFTHSLGDYDYALRANKRGFKCITTSQYIAICDRNGLPAWRNSNAGLLKRFKSLYATTGFCLLEYMRFTYVHSGLLKAFFVFLYYNFIVIFPALRK